MGCHIYKVLYERILMDTCRQQVIPIQLSEVNFADLSTYIGSNATLSK